MVHDYPETECQCGVHKSTSPQRQQTELDNEQIQAVKELTLKFWSWMLHLKLHDDAEITYNHRVNKVIEEEILHHDIVTHGKPKPIAV